MIVGPTLFDIPLEEVFFFVIQTFNTTLLYLILNKPILHPVYLVKERKGDKWLYVKLIGQVVGALLLKQAVTFIRTGGSKTYLGLILVWALPFLLLLWSLAYQFLAQLPFTSTLLPIALPTLYLWIIDTLALKRGTWVISTSTKTGISLWPGLEIEEAIFFLLTNTLIVFGLVAFDNAIAVLHAFPAHFRRLPTLPSPVLLVRALLLPSKAYDDDRILGIQQSVARLKRKSRSFYLASSTFSGRLRIDLIILYSFCRVADDLIDNAADAAEAQGWVKKLKQYLDLSYGEAVLDGAGNTIESKDANRGAATLFAVQNFPEDAQLTLLLLPTQRLAKEPLYELLKGFEMDLLFSSTRPSGPIKSSDDLDLYGARVAGTVALLCIQLVLHYHPGTVSDAKAKRLMAAGHDMGIALQYTNIARDLAVDAAGGADGVGGRCYVPPPWLKKEKLTPETFISGLRKTSNEDDFFAKKVETLRARILERAFALYDTSIEAVEELPGEARAPMRVAVESYMQIARELRRAGEGKGRVKVKAGRATVPVWKRVWVAWRTLWGRRRR